MGIVVQNKLEEKSSYEVFLNYPNFENNVSYLRYAFLHELGHVLGLEHPFNEEDGIARPYVITIDKSSRTILSIRICIDFIAEPTGSSGIGIGTFSSANTCSFTSPAVIC